MNNFITSDHMYKNDAIYITYRPYSELLGFRTLSIVRYTRG
jgi:hypothetical protein